MVQGIWKKVIWKPAISNPEGFNQHKKNPMPKVDIIKKVLKFTVYGFIIWSAMMFFVAFFIAYFSPAKIVQISINSYCEAQIEMVVLCCFIAVTLFYFINKHMTFK